METNDQQLLRRFTETRDEDAFTTLVNRHLGLVLGAASRQLGGDHHTAEDTAQQVFTRLALKASKLLGHPCLEAWLHTATRLACLEQIRLKTRRECREQEAGVSLIETTEESAWEHIAPVLDDALHALAEEDRRLILMRHIDRQSGQQLASRLGVSESAARKQLERAMTRLREQLVRRGVAVSTIVLAATLEMNLQAQVPLGLAGQIAKQVLSHSAATVTSGLFSKLFMFGLANCAAIILMSVVLPFAKQTRAARTQPSVPGLGSTAEPSNAPTQIASLQNTVASLPQGQVFVLRIVDSESGEILPNVSVCFGVSPDERSVRYIDRFKNTNGLVRIHWTNEWMGFQADVNCDGYADTQIKWIKEQGVLPVPDSWTLRLERAPQIGGIVVDEQGQPIASAKVKIWASGDFFLPAPGTHQPLVRHPLRMMQTSNYNQDTQTDTNGCWTATRMARQVQNAEFIVVIEHPDYLSDRSDGKGNQLPALQSGEYRSVMVARPNENVSITGIVFDPLGRPLTNADISDGAFYSNPNFSYEGDHYFKTDVNGRFDFRVRQDWRGKVTAKAPGYAAKTLNWSGQPLSISLQPGRSLRFQVVSKSGLPIEGIRVESLWFDDSALTNLSTRYRLAEKTDVEGRVACENVPNEPMLLNFYSDQEKFLSRCGEVAHPSDDEQIIVLQSSLKVTGTVVDAETRQVIPAFRVAHLDAFAKDIIPEAAPFELSDSVSGKLFEQGRFELLLKPTGEPLSMELRGTPEQRHLGCYFKITTPGYAAYTSRFVDVKEGEAHLHIALKTAAVKRIQVFNPSGNPEPGAMVEVCPSASPLRLYRDLWKANGDYVLSTDADGSFDLPADESIQSVIVFNRTHTCLGWAKPEVLRKEGALRLSKLRTLELSTALPDNKTQPAQPYMVELSNLSLKPFASGEFPMRRQTDSEGKCSFQNLPSGKYEVSLFTRPSTPENKNLPDGSFSLEVNESPEDPIHCQLPSVNK